MTVYKQLYPGRKLSDVLNDMWESKKHPAPRAGNAPPIPAQAEYWAKVNSVAQPAKKPAPVVDLPIPGFEPVQEMHELPEMRRTVIYDVMDLPGIADDPDLWQQTDDPNVYVNEHTGQTFELGPDGRGGVLSSPIGDVLQEVTACVMHRSRWPRW